MNNFKLDQREIFQTMSTMENQTAQAKEVYCVQLVEMIKWCSQYELSLFLPLYIGVDLRRERKERLSLLRSLLGPTLT